ncbi:hypothetical protein HFO56_24315 [Rhizobium laguerreae]|uniref:hypothetical protein n=1 Tax=Rhizobium laguerreae TaxID=1076926 RepID=UPI001C914962|nr:hypothetical protein [Rhizobium laguerreae]MBY3155455.1 hypothetical protein [Rhizobium laguerreae]
MARRPARVRNRGEGNELAPLDGFAAALPARRQEQQQQVVDPNSMGVHFNAILNSGLVDAIDDEAALERAEAHRITDNFGPAFAQYRRQVEQGGAVYDPRQPHDNGRLPPQAYLPRQQGARPQGDIHRANLPAHAPRNALVAHDPNVRMQGGGGMNGFVQLRRFGPYMLGQIRRLGRDIFAQYAGNMDLEDINMIGHIPGQPFHSQAEVRDTIRFITENGNEVTSDNIDFGHNIPGYRAQTSLWRVDNFEFLIVRDNHGEYVYGWPAAPRPAIGHAPAVPRLR